MRGLVSHQLGFQEEALAALVALERLSVCVHSLVGDEQGLVIEALLTVSALVGLGFQVAFSMSFQTATVGEPFVAMVALLRLLSSVGSLVGNKKRMVIEFLLALVAMVGFPFSMDVAMSCQQRWLGKALVA